jgi:hypothetical protein
MATITRHLLVPAIQPHFLVYLYQGPLLGVGFSLTSPESEAGNEQQRDLHRTFSAVVLPASHAPGAQGATHSADFHLEMVNV